METMVTQFAGVTGEAMPAIPKCCTVIACSDHGVYAEGVSAYPQSTTVGMTKAYVETKGLQPMPWPIMPALTWWW